MEKSETTERKSGAAVLVQRIVRRLPRFLVCLKPCKPSHGPDRTLMPWWRIVPVVVCLGYKEGWWNYGVHYSGRRLWLYTKWGGIHFDVWMETKPSNTEIRRPGPDAPESNPRRQPGSPASNC